MDFGESIIYNGLTGNPSIKDKNLFYPKEQIKLHRVNFLPLDLIPYEWKYDGNEFFENIIEIEENIPEENENPVDNNEEPIEEDLNNGELIEENPTKTLNNEKESV